MNSTFNRTHFVDIIASKKYAVGLVSYHDHKTNCTVCFGFDFEIVSQVASYSTTDFKHFILILFSDNALTHSQQKTMSSNITIICSVRNKPSSLVKKW